MTKKKVTESFEETRERILEKASPTLNRKVGGDFTKITESERRFIMLRAAPLARQPSVLWTKDRKLLRKFYVRRYLEFIDQFECEFTDRASRILGEIDQELDLAGTNDIFFNIRCEESTLFFHIQRRGLMSRNGFLLIKLPSDLYEVQRRAQLRYRTTGAEGYLFGSDFFKPWLSDLSVLDVSSGGVGIQIRFSSVEEADQFRIDQNFRTSFLLDLGVVTLKAMGEVRYFKRTVDDLDGAPVVRVGLRFVGLSQELVESIQMLVLERSYARLREIFVD